MNQYEIKLRHYNASDMVRAETAAKAKYQHFLQLGDLFRDFLEYLSFVDSIHCVSKECDHFTSIESKTFLRTKEYRGVPCATIGMKVQMNGQTGYIVGANDSCNFDVAFPNGVYNCHPNHNIVYFGDDGSVVYDFTKREEPKEMVKHNEGSVSCQRKL